MHLRVLVIDDSLTIRAMVEEIVQHEPGCRVVGVAGDVVAARQMLIDLEPNVITLDLAMPGIDGLSFLDELRSQKHAPIVVVSSSTTEGAAATAEALAHGADACFDKAKVVSDARRFLRVLDKAVQRKAAGSGQE
jgi:two-component system chemotaxis response regulator CheB